MSTLPHFPYFPNAKVIGVGVDLKKVTFNDPEEGRGVNNEQQWTQAGTLGNTAVQRKSNISVSFKLREK